MQYVRFGSLSKPVSRFGMGCMRLPKTKAPDGSEIIDEQEAVRMIRYAADHGVNYFDTAYAYNGSEAVLGRALKNGYRERVYIASKVPLWAVNEEADYRKIFMEQVERLQTDKIDVYLFHCVDREAWQKIKATNGIAAVERLRSEGLISQIGFSFHCEYSLFEEIINAYAWDMALIQLNILDDNHQAGVKGLRYAAQKGISMVIMEPLKGGLLGGNVPEQVQAELDCYPEKRSLPEWAFRWVYNHGEAKVVLSGVSSMEQLKDNIRIADAAAPNMMSKEDLALIARIKNIYQRLVRVGCTGCGYCMPCPSGVNIPEIFKVYNDAALSSWSDFGKTFYRLVAQNGSGAASQCVRCGQCEAHCPQNLPIPDLLAAAHKELAE